MKPNRLRFRAWDIVNKWMCMIGDIEVAEVDDGNAEITSVTLCMYQEGRSTPGAEGYSIMVQKNQGWRELAYPSRGKGNPIYYDCWEDCQSHWYIRPMDEVVLMQSTGLADKNGKEIFEGDIIRCYYVATSSDAAIYPEAVGPVCRADTGEYRVNPLTEGGKRIFHRGHNGVCLRYLERVEVIGNTHETPSLITGQL